MKTKIYKLTLLSLALLISNYSDATKLSYKLTIITDKETITFEKKIENFPRPNKHEEKDITISFEELPADNVKEILKENKDLSLDNQDVVIIKATLLYKKEPRAEISFISTLGETMQYTCITKDKSVEPSIILEVKVENE